MIGVGGVQVDEKSVKSGLGFAAPVAAIDADVEFDEIVVEQHVVIAWRRVARGLERGEDAVEDLPLLGQVVVD